MASQLRAVLPCMSEPINFKFLWREDHLSDYTLVICSEPESEQPLAEAEQQANELARQYRPSLTRYIQVKQDTSAQRAQQYATNRGRTPAIALTGSNIPAPCADRPVFIDPWKTTYASKPATIQGPKTSSSAAAAAAALHQPPGKQQRKRCLTAPPEASASRSRKTATSAAAAAASAAAEDASAANPAGPTTRSAKRRKQGGSNTQRRSEAAVLPPAAAAAGGGAGPDTNNSNTNPLVDLVVELASTSDSDNVDWTMDEPNAPGLRQPQCRSTRDMLSTPAATAASASQGADLNLVRGLSPAAGPSGTPAPPAAAAAAGATCSSQQQQQQQSAGEVLEAAGGTSMPAAAAAAAAAAAGPSQPALIVHRELPVHGAVLSAMSEYFRALIQNWQGSEKRLMMEVQEDEATAAEALVEFMYTGELPAVSHDDMLKVMRLSDKFQVKNCPAACAHRFSSTPMEDLSLETVCAIFDWPDFLKDAEPFKGVFSKAWSKLLELFGDLEVAWQDIARRQQFVELPHQVMKRLLSSDAVAVFCENTILVALAEWMHHQRSQLNTEFLNLGLTCSQQREVAEMVRLQHLSPTFLGSVLKRLPLMSPVLTPEALQAAARYATANEATRNKLHSLTIRQQRMKVLYAPPRARSAMQRLEFTWVLELQTVKAMIEQFRNTKVTVDRYSEPHYFNGFQWQLVLQVLEPPAKQPAAGQAAAAAAVDVFVGTTARIQIGGVQYMPDVLYFRGQLAAREVASGDYTFVNRMESGFVCGTAGWGFRNFLRITDWDNEAALRRFFYDGKLHLRCNIDHCE